MGVTWTHCGRWRKADYAKHGTGRLVCTLPRHHSGGWHIAGYSGWIWSVWDSSRAAIYRDWRCNGWVEDLKGPCGRVLRATEDEARVKGWKIGYRNGLRDPLCPQCAKPDPTTAALCRDLERSITP